MKPRLRFLIVSILLIVSAGCTIRDGRLFFDWGGSNNKKKVEPAEHVLRVLIVEKVSDRAALSSNQRAILTGKTVRDFIRSNCTKGPDGEPEFRLWDQKNEAAGEPDYWKDTLARSRQSTPYYYVENEKHGTEGPITSTMTPEDFISILKPFAEGK